MEDWERRARQRIEEGTYNDGFGWSDIGGFTASELRTLREQHEEAEKSLRDADDPGVLEEKD